MRSQRDLGECEICGTPLVDNGQRLEFWGAQVWKEEIECPNEENHPEPWDRPNEHQLADQPIVYVAGPYTSDPEGNTIKAMEVASQLVKLGFVPFIPHLTHYWHALNPRPASWWYEYDYRFLERCDVLFRIAGASKGSDDEEALARQLGIPVFYDMGNMVSARIKGEL